MGHRAELHKLKQYKDPESLERALRLAIRCGDREAQLELLRRHPGREEWTLAWGPWPSVKEPTWHGVALCWDERITRSLACDCAERVLYLWEDRYPDDRRPHAAIEATRAWVHGRCSRRAMHDIYRTAWAARKKPPPGSSARDAARAVAHVASPGVHYTLWAHVVHFVAAALEFEALESKGTIESTVTKEKERVWQCKRLASYLLGEIRP